MYRGIFVPTALDIQLLNSNNYKVEDANHLTICKPPSKDQLSYFKLLECLKIFMKANNIGFNLWELYMFI
jgi:hypothetical protein